MDLMEARSRPDYSTDPDAFLFLIRSNKGYEPDVFKIKKKGINTAAHFDNDHMCCFGNNGYNIRLCDNCLNVLPVDSWVDWKKGSLYGSTTGWEQGSLYGSTTG